MMSVSSPPPPMTQSAVYYEHQRSSNSSSPAQYYPQSAPLRQPPAVYHSHARSGPAARFHPDTTHAKSSVSSATSGSSAISELKPYRSVQPYNMGTHAERGHLEHSSRRPSQMSPSQSHMARGSHVARSEMVEDHSAVIRYLQEHEIEDDQPPEKDHAIWILVRTHTIPSLLHG